MIGSILTYKALHDKYNATLTLYPCRYSFKSIFVSIFFNESMLHLDDLDIRCYVRQFFGSSYIVFPNRAEKKKFRKFIQTHQKSTYPLILKRFFVKLIVLALILAGWGNVLLRHTFIIDARAIIICGLFSLISYKGFEYSYDTCIDDIHFEEDPEFLKQSDSTGDL